MVTKQTQEQEGVATLDDEAETPSTALHRLHEEADNSESDGRTAAADQVHSYTLLHSYTEMTHTLTPSHLHVLTLALTITLTLTSTLPVQLHLERLQLLGVTAKLGSDAALAHDVYVDYAKFLLRQCALRLGGRT